MTTSILDMIVAEAWQRAELIDRELIQREATRHQPRGFAQALTQPGPAVIAEVKRRSPSKGDLAPDLDPPTVATSFAKGGAAAVSVLTEPKHFHGTPDDLEAVRKAVDVPVLRKDFTVDPIQVVEAAAMGADAVLAIVAAVEPAALGAIIATADDYGLDTLVEVHDPAELELAAAAGARMVGVNARDLRTFQVDLDLVSRLGASLEFADVAIAESGVRFHHDVMGMMDAGYDAVLVGETLVRSPDPEAAVARLLGDSDAMS